MIWNRTYITYDYRTKITVLLILLLVNGTTAATIVLGSDSNYTRIENTINAASDKNLEIKELKDENKKILKTAEDVKPPRINFQIALRTEEDAKNINQLLSLLRYDNWDASIFTTESVARENGEFIKSLHRRGYEIGLLLEENISWYSHKEQLEVINSSSSYLSSLISTPVSHFRLKEYSVRFNELNNLLRTLQELEFKSITSHFVVDNTFPCWQCVELGYIVHPMHIGYGELIVVPIGYLPEKNILLVDELIFQNSTNEEFLYYLLQKYNETTISKLPFVVILHPSIIASEQARLNALEEFLNHVKETNGQLVDTSFMSQVANQYMATLTAEAGTEIKCPGKQLAIKGTFTSEKSCPSYYIEVYGKYENESTWTRLGGTSKHYPQVTTGTYSYEIPVIIPTPPENESKLQIWVLGRGCWPSTPGCNPPYLLSQAGIWTSVAEKEVKFDFNVLSIKEIRIQGTDPSNPETVNQVTLTAVLSDNAGATISWTGEAIAPRTTMSPHGAGANHPPEPNGANGNPLNYNPSRDTHGNKRVTAKVTWNQGGQECKDEQQRDFRLFFRKTQRDYAAAAFGGPNWYGYWSNHDDSATTSWDHSSATYTYGGNNPGQWAEYDSNVISPTYTIYDDAALDCDVGNYNPGTGFSININHRGIDCVELSLAHERCHRTTDANWQAGGAWNGMADTDGDEIPDTVEDANPGFNRSRARSFAYPIGPDDEEPWCDIQGLANIGGRNANNDWANRGKQSNPAYRKLIFENGTNAQFNGTFIEFVNDTDGDGLFNSLSILTGINVSSPGTYSFFARLHDQNNRFLASTYINSTYLDASNKFVIFNFDGVIFRKGRINGPYLLENVKLFGLNFSDDRSNILNTSAYNYKQFEPPAAEFVNVVSENAIDTNSNSLFDVLNITAKINVTQAGNYTIRAELTKSPTIDSSTVSLFLSTGENNVVLSFDGKKIRAHRKNGPYQLRAVEILDQNLSQIDQLENPYNTSSYLYTQFEKPKIGFTGKFSDYGVDADNNSLFDILRIRAEVDAQAGNYSFSAHLSGVNDTEITYNYTNIVLASGIQNITLDLDGSAIRDHEINGPYKLTSLTLHDSDGFLLSAEVDYHNTSAYNYTQFEGGGRITGSILSYNLTPIENATVFLSGIVSLSTKTNSTGSYLFNGLKPGLYDLFVISSDPNMKTNSSNISLSKGQTLTKNFVLAQAGSIAGYVILSNGTGLPNITVYWEAYESPRFVTDEDGFYYMPNLDAGIYELNAIAPLGSGLLNAKKTVNVTLGKTTPANLTLIRGSNITGIVMDVNGIPIANAYVTASGTYYNSVYTNSTGAYIITMLGLGNYTIKATPPSDLNLLENSTTVEITTEETVNANITLPLGVIIRGKVTSIEGNGIANAYITASGPVYESTHTNESGDYIITALQVGNYTITVSPPYNTNFLSNSTSLSIIAGETKTIDITLPLGGIITGFITIDGIPVEDIYVYVSGPSYGSAYTDTKGNYTIKGLETGNYTISVSPPYGLSDNSATLLVTAGEVYPINFTLNATKGMITGIVSVGSFPLKEAYVTVSGPLSKYDYANNYGRYYIFGLVNGTYNITAQQYYYWNLTSNSTFENITEGHIRIIDFELKTIGAMLTGSVADVNNKSIADAYVTVSGPGYNSAYTDVNGKYVIFNLKSGIYNVTVSPPYGTDLRSNSTIVNVSIGEVTSADIILPTLNATLSANITNLRINATLYPTTGNFSEINITVTDNVGVKSITLYTNGNYTDTKQCYGTLLCHWATTVYRLTYGVYTYIITAYGNSNNLATTYMYANYTEPTTLTVSTTTTLSTTTTIPTECSKKGDKSPCNGIVDDFELLAYIDKWAKGEVGDFHLLEAINNWAKG